MVEFGHFPLERLLLLVPAGFGSGELGLGCLRGSSRTVDSELRFGKLLSQFLHGFDRFGMRNDLATVLLFRRLGSFLELLYFPLSRSLSVFDAPFGRTHMGNSILQELPVLCPSLTLALQIPLNSGDGLTTPSQFGLRRLKFLAQGRLLGLDTGMRSSVRCQL